MLKKLGFALVLLGFCNFSLAAHEHESTLNTMANNVTVREASVDFAKMGFLSQSSPNANALSTEVKMDLRNHGSAPVILVAATSEAAAKVQLHQIITKLGKQRMERIQQIDIQGNTKKDLSYQGVHIMLIGLKKPLHKNQSIPLTLIYADGSAQQVNAVVR